MRRLAHGVPARQVRSELQVDIQNNELDCGYGKNILTFTIAIK